MRCRAALNAIDHATYLVPAMSRKCINVAKQASLISVPAAIVRDVCPFVNNTRPVGHLSLPYYVGCFTFQLRVI